MGKKKNRGGGQGRSAPAGEGVGVIGTVHGEENENEVVVCEDEELICEDGDQAVEKGEECEDEELDDGNGGKKKGGNNGGKKKEENGGKKEGGKKGGGGSVTAVLKVDFHCDGCTERIRRSIKGFKGVEGVKVERENNKLTVVGSMDPHKLLEKIQKRTKKKLELISPKKEGDNNNNKKNKNANSDNNHNNNNNNNNQPKDKDDNNNKKEENKKEENKKEKTVLNVSNVVVKIPLHCDGCIRRIKATILKISGVEQVIIDTKKSQVSIKGTMKTKGLPDYISQKIKKPVQVIDSKKEKDNNNNNNNNQKKNNNEKKGQDGATCHGDDVAASGWYVDECGYSVQIVYPPMLFSDDNPNACSVM